MKRKSLQLTAATGVCLFIAVVLGLASEDKYSVKVPGGLAFSEFRGRIGNTGMIRSFPPVAVPFYDGSRPNNYVYQTLINQVIDGPNANLQAPRAELLSSVDGGSSWSVTEPPSIGAR